MAKGRSFLSLGHFSVSSNKQSEQPDETEHALRKRVFVKGNIVKAIEWQIKLVWKDMGGCLERM